MKDDALVFDLSNTKSDQAGKNNIKRRYANALEPDLCPILALALHILALYLRMKIKQSYRSAYKTFTEWLKECMEETVVMKLVTSEVTLSIEVLRCYVLDLSVGQMLFQCF